MRQEEENGGPTGHLFPWLGNSQGAVFIFLYFVFVPRRASCVHRARAEGLGPRTHDRLAFDLVSFFDLLR